MNLVEYKNDKSKIISIAGEIRRYLVKTPSAAETVDGIARWWLSRQRFEDSVELVQAALDYLESKGEVEKQTSTAGYVTYRRSYIRDHYDGGRA